MRGAIVAPLLLATALAVATAAAAQEEEGEAMRAWQAEKCRAYAAAWDAELLGTGTDGLGAAFLGGNEDFIASGCDAGRDICPESDAEFAMANRLTIAAMNMGAASTFLPFACR